ncbi:MAG: hypothetical protein WAO16_31915, partial [Pseudolabrys sp.]
TTTDALFNAHVASIRKRSSANTTRRIAMAIHRLIAVGTFGPDEIKAMTAAYESALTDLGFADREDPLTELIAKSIVNVTATGERDPERIKERALNALGVRSTAA